MLHRRKFIVDTGVGLTAGAALLLVNGANAEAVPPAKIIVANPPGGQTDLFARVVAQGIQRRTGQIVTVENRPGAGGLIGLQALLTAPADGNTLLLTTLASLISPALQKRSVDVLSQMEPVALLASGGSLVLVNDRVAATDLASFIALAKQQPGRLTYASGGPGSTAHLVTEYMKAQLGIDLTHVPYKGGAPAALAIHTGEVDVTILDEANAAPLLKDGKVRVVAQTGAIALASYPKLARVADAAPGFDASFWMGIALRKGGSEAAADRLNQLVNDIVQNDLQDAIKRAGFGGGGGSRSTFGNFLTAESEKWLRIVRSNNITSS